MALEFYDAPVGDPSGASAGIFLPISNLPGVIASEFGSGVDVAIKTGKALAGIFNQVYAILSPDVFNKLGFTVSKGNPTGTGGDTFTITYTMTIQYLSSLKDDSYGLLPIPTTGANNGVGKFAIAEIFSSAEIVAADGAISGEGLLIPFADLNEYGGPATIANISAGQDNRDWLAGLYRWLVDSIPVRATGTTSAVTAKSLGANTGVTLASTATDATNPTTGIEAADLNKISVGSRQVSMTVDFLLNQTTQTFDVNAA